jgi:hypothetical protein
MSKKLYPVIAGIALLLLAATPMAAHHSFAAEYDISKPVKLHGSVTKIEWVNPHAWVYVDVKDPDGKVTNWHIELGSPSALFRNGWKRDAIPVGLEVDVVGYRSKIGEAVANAAAFTLPDGRVLSTGGSSPGTVPKP